MGDDSRRVVDVASAASLSLYSQNTWGVPTAPDIKERYSRFEEILDVIPADVYSLQETFSKSKTQKFIIDPWRKKHPYFASANEPDLKRGRLIGGGLTALSKYPITRQHFISFKDASFSDRFSNKGVLLVTVRLPNGIEFDIYNTHMQADYPPFKSGVKVRGSQLKQLQDMVKAYSGTERNVLVVGDLNIKEKTSLYYELVDIDSKISNHEIKYIDVLRQLYPDDKRYHLISFRNRNPKKEKRIDYILLRPANGWKWDKDHSAAEVLDMLFADHNGIFTTLTVVKE